MNVVKEFGLFLVLIICLVLLASTLTGCGAMEVKQVADPNTFYKRDMVITVNGKKSVGVSVAPRAPSYNLYVQAYGQLDLLTYTSCHRDQDFTGLSRDHTYSYVPVQGIEETATEACPLVLGGYDKPNGRHSWGQVVFEDPAGLEATAFCNGERTTGRTSACQNLEGQISVLEFAKPVKAAPECDYQLKDEGGGKRWSYRMPARECVAVFCTREMKCHNHYSIGYKQQLVRGK